MRHMYIRGILALIWLAAAIFSTGSGRVEMALFYVVLCGVFGYSAYASWRRERDERKGR